MLVPMAGNRRNADFHRQVMDAVRVARQHARAGRPDVGAVIDVAFAADETALVYACMETGGRPDEESRAATELLEQAVLGLRALPPEWIEHAIGELKELRRTLNRPPGSSPTPALPKASGRP